MVDEDYDDMYADWFQEPPGPSPMAQPGKFKGYFLVRDKNGKPKFDDIFNIADEFWNDLTKQEQQDIINERKTLDKSDT